MKFIIIFLIVCTFSTQCLGHADILKIRDNVMIEVENILNAIGNVRKDVDKLLIDVKPSSTVHDALDTLSKNNLTICLNHCKRSTGEEEGANINEPVQKFHTEVMKIGKDVHDRIDTICDCASKKQLTNITPKTFEPTLQCIDTMMEPLPAKMNALIDSAKILEKFLNNITNRIQFDCLIHLMGKQTPEEKIKSEQRAVDCLSDISRTLYPTCKPMNDKIFEHVKDIKDYMSSASNNLNGCVKNKMEEIRQRLIKENNFDFNKC